MLLLRPYAQTVFEVYAKVRKSAQFENFPFLCHQNSKLIYEANLPALNICSKSIKAQNGLKKFIRAVFLHYECSKRFVFAKFKS